MIGRLKSGWFTAAAVVLLLFGGLVLDSLAMAVVAGVLVVAGLVFMPRERVRGGAAAVIAFVVAASLVVILRLMR